MLTVASISSLKNPPVRKAGGAPRLDQYTRVIQRFYEPLILLEALGRTRGPHTEPPSDANIYEGRRRRFLGNLAFVADYDKGGPSTTAIAVESQEDVSVFWFSTNINEPSGTQEFLLHVFDWIRKVLLSNSPHQTVVVEQHLTKHCLEFASKRLKEETKFLRVAVRECLKFLDAHDVNNEDSQLRAFLLQFESGLWSREELCRIAYSERRSSSMKTLMMRAQDSSSIPNEQIEAFRRARHQVGRLAHHIRAPKQLVEDAPYLHGLIDRVVVRPVDPSPPVPKPMPDGQTKLAAMIKRMLPSNHGGVGRYQDALIEMDRRHHILDKVLATYEKMEPQVHAEVQVLEHFYAKGLAFAGGDRYIACSKPACLCCRLYIRHHPARCVEPQSHQKVYHNWSPPGLPPDTDRGDPAFYRLRDVLIAIGKTVREDALKQILALGDPHMAHADSITGITASLDLNGPGREKLEVVDEDTWSEEALASSSADSSSDDGEPASSVFSAPDDSSGSSQLSSWPSSRKGSPSNPELNDDSDSDYDGGGRL